MNSGPDDFIRIHILILPRGYKTVQEGVRIMGKIVAGRFLAIGNEQLVKGNT